MLKSIAKQNYPTIELTENEIKRHTSDMCLLLIAFCTILAASFVFLYSDMVDMVCNSNLLLKSILDGKLLDYYTYTLEQSWSSFAANYDFPLYFVFALWNLPVALIFHFEINGVVYLWNKLLIVLCITACSFLMYRIYALFDAKRGLTKGSFLLLMSTSPFVFLGEFIAGQYDCICMILILAGVYEYLEGNEKRFLLLFVLALPIKTFAVFIYIPLLVFREKGIFRIALKTALVFIVPILCKFLFSKDPAYSFLLGAQNRDAAELLTKASIQISNIDIHLFVFAFFVICLFCYFQRFNKNKVLLICTAVFTLFIIFVPIRSYWVFLAEPFLILLVASATDNYRTNFLLHSLAEISGSIFFLYFHSIYNSYWMTRGLGLIQIANLPEVVKYGSFSNFINVHGWAMYMPLLRTVFVGSCITLIIINTVDFKKLHLSSPLSIRFLVWVKYAVVLGMLCIMVFVETFPCTLPIIDTLDYSDTEIRPYIDYRSLADEVEEVNENGGQTEVQVLSDVSEDSKVKQYYSADINSRAVIDQPFTVSDERKVSEICFQCNNTDESRWNRGRISISILNADTDEVLSEAIIGSSMVTTGEIYIAKMDEVYLKQGRYKLRFTNIETPSSGAIYMMCNTDNRESEPAVINGQVMKYPICICVN